MNLSPKKYTTQAKSDSKSISVIEDLLDENFAISHLNKHDKIPNHDGHIDLIDAEGFPIGEIKVQVKTLRKGAKKVSHPVEIETFQYADSVVQIPFVFIVVDQTLKKAYWKEINKSLAQYYIEKYNNAKKKQDSYSIEFETANEIGENPPYDDWNFLVTDLKNNLQELDNLKNVSTIKINEKSHLIDQLNDLFKVLYSELEFIPLHMLTQQFPIKVKINSRYNNFILHSYNDEFNSLFQSVEIKNQNQILVKNKKFFKGIKNVDEKLNFIFNKLTTNLIYHISIPKESEYFDSQLFNNSKCDCSRCQIEKFSFDKIDFSKDVNDSKIDNLMNKAYAHYKMGHFKNAYQAYKLAESEALTEKKNLKVFIIRYNLIHLASFLEYSYYGDQRSKEIAQELRSINLSNSIFNTKNKYHRELQQWMLNDHYMLHFHSRISELKQQLIDHFQNSKNGGFGTNNYVNDLTNLYIQLHQFLQLNTIINDCYKSFLDIFEMVVEGLFASYAVEGVRSSKIDNLNDWILIQIIKYGRTPSLRKLSNRYKINELRYTNSSEENDSVKELITRLFSQFEIASEKLQSFEEPNYDHFSNNYNRWLNNSLFLVGIIDFEETFIRSFTDTFIAYYKRKTHLLSTTEINAFLVRKFYLFTQEQRKNLFTLGIEDEQLTRSYFLHNFADLSVKQNLTYELSEIESSVFLQKSLDEISNGIAIVQIYRCLSDDGLKNKIREKIVEELKGKFQLEFWSTAVLYNVIQFEDSDLDRAIDSLIPEKNIAGQPANMFGGSRYNGGLDQLINVCFEKEVDLTTSKFDGLRENSLYYQWLLNIDGFNYNDFDPSWLLEYDTKSYLKRFAKSETLKKHVEKLLVNLKEKDKVALKEAYMEIYVLKSWEK